MVRHGRSPYFECSSRGDCRFSAFSARPSSLKGRSIEDAYQAAKRFEDGTTGLTWRQAKGRFPTNLEECQRLYRYWWEEWLVEQDLLPTILRQTGLSDFYGQKGHTCQATTLWAIRQDNR